MVSASGRRLSVAIGRGDTLETIKEIHFPHSLGLLYSAFTYYTGFKVNSGEYKVMGLAPYGEPKYGDLILEHLIDLKEDGSFWLDQSYFDYATGLTMTSEKFHALFGGPARDPESPLTQRHMDLAASVQHVTEEVMLRMARDLRQNVRDSNLCLAGGVALNCVANGKIVREGMFKRIWVQPAAGDAGGALGAAYAAHALHARAAASTRTVLSTACTALYLGPAFDRARSNSVSQRPEPTLRSLRTTTLLDHTVDSLTDGNAVGWFQGRMEFGPRALGARSILGDPRNPNMQKTLNLKIKYRESFRPFAPSVLARGRRRPFEFDVDSPTCCWWRTCSKTGAAP